VVAYHADPRKLPSAETATRLVEESAAEGFDALVVEQRRAWEERWSDADVKIEGDDELQLATRFSLFHLMASVADDGEAAVGARGLSGPGYRGHVFWDADTFTLPFLAATHPASARAMLEYRLRRLAAAQDIARTHDRTGARFPWESAATGFDVTPTSARDRTGRVVPIRTGALEEHIVADVSWAACCYLDWTGDEEFASGPGLRILVETARYWTSRIRVTSDGRAHIYGVIGPDEYHEPVDDNAFTNVMARWNLRKAADAVEMWSPDAPLASGEEVTRWRELADALVDGYDPDTGIYEQFAGFYGLEPLLIAEVAPRRPIAAHLLLGSERVRRSQILKQADVLMLHHLVPDEVVPGSLEPNLRYYEPRTAHGSSLSPGIHAALFARAHDDERALDALRLAARMDLDDLTGSTASGLHLATMGSLWQALAWGFAGVRPGGSHLELDPHLPSAWGALELCLVFRGSRVRVRIEHGRLLVTADPPVRVSAGGTPCTPTRDGIGLHRRGLTWEQIR
jgi:trehalose/maltose hydrolase-like predicted phosphorylase